MCACAVARAVVRVWWWLTLCRGYSATTDAAAAASALATGKKTDNGMAAVDPESKAKVASILENARQAGLKTGNAALRSVLSLLLIRKQRLIRDDHRIHYDGRAGRPGGCRFHESHGARQHAGHGCRPAAHLQDRPFALLSFALFFSFSLFFLHNLTFFCVVFLGLCSADGRRPHVLRRQDQGLDRRLLRHPHQRRRYLFSQDIDDTVQETPLTFVLGWWLLFLFVATPELEKVAKLPVLGLFADKKMDFAIDQKSGDKKQPTLLQMTKKALDLLHNDKGFFLVVEGTTNVACVCGSACAVVRVRLTHGDVVLQLAGSTSARTHTMRRAWRTRCWPCRRASTPWLTSSSRLRTPPASSPLTAIPVRRFGSLTL
jgi:hypothetical protein